MGWVGHDLKTGEIICLGRWLVRFQFLGWATLTWGWVRIGIRPLENWLGILHEVGLSEPGQFFSGSD